MINKSLDKWSINQWTNDQEINGQMTNKSMDKWSINQSTNDQ